MHLLFLAPAKNNPSIGGFFKDIKNTPKVIRFDEIIPHYDLVNPIDPLKAGNIMRATQFQVSQDLSVKVVSSSSKFFGPHRPQICTKSYTPRNICPNEELLNFLPGKKRKSIRIMSTMTLKNDFA